MRVKQEADSKIVSQSLTFVVGILFARGEAQINTILVRHFEMIVASVVLAVLGIVVPAHGYGCQPNLALRRTLGRGLRMKGVYKSLNG